MTTNLIPHIIFVDDEPSVCKAVSQILMRQNYHVTCFFGAKQCLEQIERKKCDLLITDVNMPEMDGIEMLKEIKKRQPNLPILVVTGYADIPLAIRAIKAGAEEFIEKPLNKDTLLPTVKFMLQKRKKNDPFAGYFLTPAEKTVLQHVIAGKSNREIAGELHRSIRTIEDHRARIMHKLGVKNLVELVKISMNMDITDTEE